MSPSHAAAFSPIRGRFAALDPLERRVLEHQAPFDAVREANGHDSAGVDPRHDPLGSAGALRDHGPATCTIPDTLRCSHGHALPGP